MVDTTRLRDRLDASTWTGVGLLGLLVFLIGVAFPYLPGTHSIPGHAWLPIVIAVGGGIVLALGFGFAYDLREEAEHPKRRAPPEEGGGTGSVAAVPSFEIYRPGDDDGPKRPS
jgi:hypothetical protein